MKKLFTLLALVVMTTINAQAPQGFNYQATVRNSTGALIVNQNVYFKFNLMLNSQTSVPVFTETHYVPTDDVGQVNLVIGQGTATTGTFASINWGTGNYYLGIELNTGSGYVAMGTTQLLSVPYALYANSSGNSNFNFPNGTNIGDTLNWIWNGIAWVPTPTAAVIPQITTTIISAVTSSTASSGGLISNNGGATITAKGVCWSTSPNPTIALTTKTNNGIGTATFTSNITGLLPITSYYVRAFATNSFGTAYGQEEVFTSLATLPSLTTTVASSITSATASSGGIISSDGGAPITDRGIVWSTSTNPTITTNQGLTSDGTGLGSFTSAINQLTPDTLYYIRAYASNSAGTGYGNQITFRTLPVLATITSSQINQLTSNSVIIGSTISTNLGANVTARGVCWSTSLNPNVDLITKTVDGSGSGIFSSSITQLIPATTYYVRAYATNAVGTAYGNEISFTTLNSNSDVQNVVYINDSVLENVIYHQTSYLYPTKLVFSNLTNVNGYIYFHQTNNIVEIEFPLLTNTSEHVYFSQNLLLKKIKAPNLVSIKGYLYVYGNTILEELNICNLNSIYCSNQEPYFNISNNNALIDNNQPCFNATLYGTTLTTMPITQFSQNTAIGGGTYTNTCGLTYFGKICWSTSPNPTINNYSVNASNSNLSFTGNLTSLLPNTTYYVRAYHDNGGTVIYGNEVSFTTLP